MLKLGDVATDRLSGFTGVLAGVADYLTGCTQYLIIPKGLHEGKPIGGEWFDESRIEGVDPAQASNGGISGGDRAPRT